MGGAMKRQRVLNAIAAAAVAIPAVLNVGIGTAQAQGATFVAFTQTFRLCDFSTKTHVGPTGYAGPSATVRTTGAEVVADVQVVRAIPA